MAFIGSKSLLSIKLEKGMIMGELLISRVSLGFSEAHLASDVILGMRQRLVFKLEVLSCGKDT